MLDRLIPVIAVGGIAALGSALLRRRLAALHARKDRAVEFHNRLGDFWQSSGRDASAYHWLTGRATKMQMEMGSHGILGHMRPPFANYMIPNWPIVLNGLPEIQSSLASMLPQQAAGYAQILKDALVRYMGSLDDRISEAETENKNVLICFREGIQTIVRAPLYFLFWLGLRPAPRLAPGKASRLAAGIVSLVTLLSTVISLVLGWEPFVELVRRVWISRFH